MQLLRDSFERERRALTLERVNTFLDNFEHGAVLHKPELAHQHSITLTQGNVTLHILNLKLLPININLLIQIKFLPRPHPLQLLTHHLQHVHRLAMFTHACELLAVVEDLVVVGLEKVLEILLVDFAGLGWLVRGFAFYGVFLHVIWKQLGLAIVSCEQFGFGLAFLGFLQFDFS